jgi:BASS family bile acid:Na+ symporter
MTLIIGAGVPLLIILMMTVVGLELTPADLKRIAHYPAQVAVCLLGQVLVLPPIAAVLIVSLRLEPAIAGGLILAATAPQSTISNYFCLLGRANVPLSVTVTAVSSVLAVVSTPIVSTIAFDLLLVRQSGLDLPAGKVMQQVVTGLVLPVAAGMMIRRLLPEFVGRNRVRLQRLSMLALAAMLLVILADQAANIQRNLAAIVLAAALFTASAAALGFGIAKALSWTTADTLTVLAGFPSRSLAVATLIAVNVFGRLDFLAFAATFFMVQAALLVPAMLAARSRIGAG